jgi:hypothetical protein
MLTVSHKGQLEGFAWRRWMALGCMVLVLVFAGLEATHAHLDAKLARSSGPCAVCISVHANAPAVTFHPFPTLLAVELVTIPFQAEGHGIAAELALFIRPPPTA